MMYMSRYLRQPPRIKILEALGAIADDRIKIIDDKRAEVVSSDGTRQYTVAVDYDKRRVYSNDNGTRFRKYIGYPIIAFLMKKGILPYDERLAQALKGIPWKKLNEKYKKYGIVEEIVKKKALEKGVMPVELDQFVEKSMRILRSIKLVFDDKLISGEN